MSIELRDLRNLYPFDSHYFHIGARRMHYVDEGTGPVILMVHGNPTWSFYFRELIKALRDQYRVIAPDHIGCGLSDKPQNYTYTLATHIDNLSRLIDHLKLTDVTLAVHDWGGAIGLGWAVEHPELARRFVLFNTAAFLGGPTPLRIRVCGWPLVGDVVVRSLNGFARAAAAIACKRRERMSAEVKRGYLLPYNSYANRIAILRFVRDIPLRSKVPSHAVLKRIESLLPTLSDRPMVIFWGARDFCFNDWFLGRWRSLFPNAAVHHFADAGHYVVEDAHERILPLMRQFLEQTASTPPP